MLSKSAARTFFLGGTGLCTVAFVLLTLDSVSQLDERSHFDAFTPEAKRGYETYLNNNCMGCHTLLGEGAYYAPELTKVVSRRGEGWIRTFLKDPEAMYPGRRKMVKYAMFDPKLDPEAEANITDVIAFFRWVEGIDTNGFPPQPDLAQSPPPEKNSAQAKVPAPATFGICKGCHSLDGQGGNVGPALDGVSTRFSAQALHAWIKSPQSVKPNTTMPNLGLTDEVVAELVAFLGKQE